VDRVCAASQASRAKGKKEGKGDDEDEDEDLYTAPPPRTAKNQNP